MSDDNPDSSGRTGRPSAVTSTTEIAPDVVFALLGTNDANLRALEKLLPADIHVRGNRVTLSGAPEDVAGSERVLTELLDLVRRGTPLTPDLVRSSVSMLSQNTAPGTSAAERARMPASGS